MNKQETYSNFIKHFRVDKNIFLLGQYEKRITIYSQQLRALNLIHALIETGEVDKTSKIGILGGGIGGLTLAYGFAIKGIKEIVVYEENKHLFQTWGSSPRWIDPFLYSWPKKEWINDQTKLPFFNWSCDIASNVSKSFLKEHQILNSHFDAVVIKLKTKGWVDEKLSQIVYGSRSDKKQFDKIFLATGFGFDGKTNDVQSTYWAADNLAMLSNQKKHFYISGMGDGGIANLFRLKINSYDFNMIRSILSTDEMLAVSSEIIKIEKKAKQLYSRKTELTLISDFIQSKYNEIECPDFDEEIASRLKDSTVSIQSLEDIRYNVKAFPLNRFLLSRIFKLDEKINFLPYAILNLEDLKKPTFSLSDQKVIHEGVMDDKFKEVKIDFFISRHGPLKPLESETFDPISNHNDLNKIKALNLLDVTGREKLFKRNYFEPNKGLKRELGLTKKNKSKLDPTKTIKFFPKEQNYSLIRHISEELELASTELEIPNQVFNTEDDYLKGLMEILPHLTKGCKINAVCGDKEWNSEWVKKYFEMNYDAVSRGVKISRIFLLQKGNKRIEQNKTIIEQERNGVSAHKVEDKIGSKIMTENQMPSTFGFAIISYPNDTKSVIVHDLSEDNDGFTGVKFTSPILVKHYLDMWFTLFNYKV